MAICDRCGFMVEAPSHRLPRSWSNVVVTLQGNRYENPQAEVCGVCAVEAANENFRSVEARERYNRLTRTEEQNEDTNAFIIPTVAWQGATPAVPMVSEGS